MATGLGVKRKYPSRHDDIRAAWTPRVSTGNVLCQEVVCLYSDRRILPGMAWDLAHNEDGTTYRGPAHAKCNRSEGARRRQRQLGRRSPKRQGLIVDTVNEW